MKRVFSRFMKGLMQQLFLLASVASFAAPFFAGQGVLQRKISINVENAEVKIVLKKIEETGSVRFVYQPQVVNTARAVSLAVEEMSIGNVLNMLFDGGAAYEEMGDLVVIKPRSNHASASDIVSGRITDAKTGEPLPGVNVAVKGTSQGTSADAEGKYALAVEDPNAVLVFSFVGYISQEAAVGAQSVIDIQLSPDQKQLEEVVVVGYGVQKKVSLTSAVSVVKTDEFKDAPFTNITGALAGRASGVVVNSSGGEPGSVPAITIRGGEPLIGKSDPLYVIDGIIRDKGTFTALNINDVESISFLKDAASTAVFGAQASGGIVLVTTKGGGTGKPQIEYSGNFSFNTPSLFPKLINSYDKALVSNAISESQGNGKNSQYSPEILETIRNGSNPDFPNTDWYNLAFKSAARQDNHNLSLSGGTKLTKYYLGFGMLNQGSNYVNNAQVYKRYSFNSRMTNTFEDTGLTLAVGLNGYLTHSTAPPAGTGTIFSHIVAKSPLDQAFNKDGSFSGLVDHPLAEIFSPGYARERTSFVDGNVTLKWEVPWVKGLSARALLDYSMTTTYNKTFTALAPQYNRDGTVYPTAKPSLSEKNEYWTAYNNEFQLGYNRTFGEHGIEAALVSIVRAGQYKWNSASRKNFPSAAVDQMFAGDASTQVNDGSASDWGNVGLVGRLRYDYALKYFIELAGRYDGSDFFPASKRFGLFPAVSVGWALSSEKFYEQAGLQKVFSLLKFRGSYGKTGATGKDDTKYSYVKQYTTNANTFVSGGSLSNGFSEGDLTSANQNITWYATVSADLALDFETLNRKLSGTFDYFDTQTKNILGNPAYRYVEPLGKSLPQVLTDATTHKRGFDASLRYNFTINKNWRGYAGFNCTFFNYLWTVSNEDSVTLSNPYTRQQGINQNFQGAGSKDNPAMYQSNGLYQSYEQILNNPWRLQSSQLGLGDNWLADTNGDGRIDGEDFRRLGKSQSPQFVYGIPLGISFKNITIDALLQGTGRRDVYLGNLLQGGEGASRINFEFQKDFWTPDNTGASYPRAGTSAMNSSNNYVRSTFWLKNAQYLRLKTFTIAYDLSPFLKGNKFLRQFSIHFSGNNLLTWSPVSKYFDPELGDSNNFFYPVNKTYAIGIRAAF